MKRTLAIASIAAVLYACTDSTTPLTQEQADEAVATSLAGAGVDPNATTSSGREATPPPVSCSYDAATKWTTCGPTTVNGLTITRQMQFLTGSGTPQQRPDSNTRSMKSKTAIAGTITMQAPPGAPPVTGSTTVNRNSEETVTGLGPGSTSRIVNGSATGTEDSQFTDARGSMAVKRAYTDTTTALTFPAAFDSRAPWPTTGTIIRNIKSSASLAGVALKDFVSREVQTFSAGGKLTIVTTMNGQTRTCVIQLVAPSLPPAQPPKPVCTQG